MPTQQLFTTVVADVISDLTSSSPDQHDSDNGVLVDESGSGSGISAGEASLSDMENNVPQREENPVLPETVTVLDGPSNSKVYLIGTAHFRYFRLSNLLILLT